MKKKGRGHKAEDRRQKTQDKGSSVGAAFSRDIKAFSALRENLIDSGTTIAVVMIKDRFFGNCQEDSIRI